MHQILHLQTPSLGAFALQSSRIKFTVRLYEDSGQHQSTRPRLPEVRLAFVTSKGDTISFTMISKNHMSVRESPVTVQTVSSVYLRGKDTDASESLPSAKPYASSRSTRIFRWLTRALSRYGVMGIAVATSLRSILIYSHVLS